MSLNETLKNSDRIKTLIDQTKQNLNSINSEEGARFAVFLPETIDGIRFANNIQHIGQINGIVVEEIKIIPVPDGVNAGQNGSAAKQSLLQGVVNTFSLENKIQSPQAVSPAAPKTATTNGKKYATTKAHFSFSSTYESFQLFLNDLEKSLSLLNVTSLSLVPETETTSTKKINGASPIIYQFTVELETYSLK